MNGKTADRSRIRVLAEKAGVPLTDAVLRALKKGVERGEKPVTLFAACPNSEAVTRASIRAAKRAEVPVPSLHSFRRAFALACLRSGMDLISLQRLMGHADLTVLRRYLAQTVEDLGAAHEKHGPVDGLL